MAPTDLHSLTLSTTTEAADAYNRALRRILLVRAGAEEAMADAAAADGLLRVRPELDRLDRRPSRADLHQLSALCPVAEMAA